MPRVARFNYRVENGVYHVISRTAVERYFTDIEKDKLLEFIKHFTLIYFAKVYGFCIMGNHFHLIVQMYDGKDISEEQMKRRYNLYKSWCVFNPKYNVENQEDMEKLRAKWSNLSDMIKDIKQTFTRYYNLMNNRRGYLWGGRYKCVLLEKGQALVNCMAYIDLNPIRAGIVHVPEDYRWNSLYYHAVRKNKGNWLNLDYHNPYCDKNEMSHIKNNRERFLFYRRYMYKMGVENHYKTIGKIAFSEETIPVSTFDKAKENNFEYGIRDEFKHRYRYFSDALIIGSKEFVELMHGQYKNRLFDKRKRKFPRLKLFGDMYSMRELRKDFDRAA